MFATATKNFVEDVDNEGFLIPVSSLNDTINLLSLVIKRKPFWFWQKPKYLPTDFTLNNVLTGEIAIMPVVIETDFIKYDGTSGGNMQGNLEANFFNSNVNLEGKDTSKLQSSFGSLKKEELDLQKLLQDSKDRVLDLSHCLIQQTREKHREVFGVVKERIVTTQPCFVVEEVQQAGQLGGLLSLCGPKSLKVSFKENSNLGKDSNVTMEIPPHTTIAYGLTELEVKRNGHYELCLMMDTDGGFEVDGPVKKELVGVSGAPANAPADNWLKRELDTLSSYFQMLLGLEASVSSSLLQNLITTMEEISTVSLLESVLSRMRLGVYPSLENVKEDADRQNVQAILDIIELSDGDHQDQTVGSSCALVALHLVASALDEMSEDSRALLTTCCSTTVLKALELLVQSATEGGSLSLNSAGLAPLAGDIYPKIELLFASSGVSLKRHEDTLRMETSPQPGRLPLVLCIAIKGLASLAHCV